MATILQLLVKIVLLFIHHLVTLKLAMCQAQMRPFYNVFKTKFANQNMYLNWPSRSSMNLGALVYQVQEDVGSNLSTVY